MEKLKVHYSQLFLERKRVEALEKEIRASEALHCYWNTHKMKPKSFEACLVRDGFFMIELFRKNTNLREYAQVKRNDIVFNIRLMKPRLERDMLLFDNQIPLSALRMLFELTEPKDEHDNFVPLVLSYFEFSGKHIPYDVDLITPLDDIPHLLGLVYEALVLGKKRKPLVPETPVQPSRERKLLFESITIWSIFLRLVQEKVLVWKTAQQPNNQGKSCDFIRTAVALEQVGVKFVKADDNAVFHGINFIGKEFSIPRLVIDDNTESFFRNLVAYEQYSKNYRLHRVTDYLQVMDCLINTSTDVELLRHYGIIVNRIGDDEKVSTMFNHLYSGVYFDQNNFFYNQMFDEVNKFCKKRRNAWMAKLKTEYFSNPWTLISFLGALTLLLLTTAQTVFSVLSYINQPKS
ncbi:hypothetical protein TIFTF001_034280 [Ficus carica]|uniref:Uncharacterized protein n=1 Tax=Ficus carica TaxID=3494 RepID=A0AA88E049_FICCA|nr:hypothetical protein TIFTF001_034280 [Ficus carica]